MNPDRLALAVALALTVALWALAAQDGPQGAQEAPGRAASAQVGVALPPTDPDAPGAVQRTSAPRTDLLAAERARLRRAKCRIIVTELYPDSGFLCYVDFFCAEHERLGMPEAWWDSLVYGAANFSLRVGGIAPGGCAGPMDVKRRPLVLDPEENIRWHCREMAGFYRRGVRGLDLCEHVYLPRAPRDWGGGRFAKTDARHRACIARAYRDGRLP